MDAHRNGKHWLKFIRFNETGWMYTSLPGNKVMFMSYHTDTVSTSEKELDLILQHFSRLVASDLWKIFRALFWTYKSLDYKVSALLFWQYRWSQNDLQLSERVSPCLSINVMSSSNKSAISFSCQSGGLFLSGQFLVRISCELD